MTGDSAFSPTDDVLSLSADLDIVIAEGSEDSGQILEEDSTENEVDSEQNIFGIESTNFADASEQVFGFESNDLGNDREQVLEFGSNEEGNNSKQGLSIDNDNRVNNSDQLLTTESDYHENYINCDTTIIDDQNGVSRGKGYPPPVVGMEFESYDDAYHYYNSYAKQLGFAIRVKSSWTKRNSKEKRGAVLCCNSEGFKAVKEASSRRKETRTGCLAMIRLRLVESNRWRVDEIKLEHNHLFDFERAQNSKSHKKIDAGVKRKLEPPDVEVRTIKLYRTPVVDATGYGSSSERDMSNQVDQSKRLKLKKGDVQVMQNYFFRVQLTNPNFFYVMDLNDEGHLRNVFWIDSRSRAAYGYFGDVVALDTTCLSNEYEIPLLALVGVNHHGRSILLGCGLLADETLETYIWLLRAWLTCMLGRPPQTIITDQCKELQTAIAEVFPRAHHQLCLSLVIQSILDIAGELQESEFFRTVLIRTGHSCIKANEFEIAWEDMIQRFGIRDHEWLRALYEDRERWAPVYSKDTFFAGMFSSQPGEFTTQFFDGHVHRQTTLKEFFDIYEIVLQKKYQKEALDDFESKESGPMLKTSCPYELQLLEVYTKELFTKFQKEVEMMSSCLSITQIQANGPIATYMIKEKEEDGTLRGTFEVIYDKAGMEVRCICSCFNFQGYLCRHALCVLNYNGVEEIPAQYILSRWRKDFKRMYVPDIGSNSIDITNPVQWFDHLYRRALQVVEKGVTTQDHYTVAWQAFKESLNKVRLVADKHV